MTGIFDKHREMGKSDRDAGYTTREFLDPVWLDSKVPATEFQLEFLSIARPA